MIIFGVSLNEIPILEYEYNSQGLIDIGIEQKISGIVPQYEEYSVMDTRGYTIVDWEKLDTEKKASEIAFVRIKSMIEHQQSQKDLRESKRKKNGI